jgi:hypothetical protein
MTTKYYSDEDLLEMAYLYFNLKSPFDGEVLSKRIKQENAKWHPDKALPHEKDRYNTYFQIMSPVATLLTEKIKENPKIFQKINHMYKSNHFGPNKDDSNSKTDEAYEKDKAVREALERQRKVFSNERSKENNALREAYTLELEKQRDFNIVLCEETERMEVEIKRLEKELSDIKNKPKEVSATDVLTLAGLNVPKNVITEKNMQAAKNAIGIANSISSLFRKQ